MLTRAQKIENRNLALASLRSAPEDQRAMGTAVSPEGRMCACAFLAKPLGIALRPGMLTADLIEEIAEKTNIPFEILALIPGMNDKEKEVNGVHELDVPALSFAKIAQIIEDENTLTATGG